MAGGRETDGRGARGGIDEGRGKRRQSKGRGRMTGGRQMEAEGGEAVVLAQKITAASVR